MFERATRECSRSPQIATVRPGDAALAAADRQAVEQGLRRVLVAAVAGVDDGAADLTRQQRHGPALVVAHDEHVGVHGVERHRRVDQCLALLDRRESDRHVDDVSTQTFACELERCAGSRRGLEK